MNTNIKTLRRRSHLNLELNLIYVCNKSTTTNYTWCFVSLLQEAEPRRIFYQYIINVRWKVTYLNGTFTLYYTGAVTIATKLRQKELRQGISSDNSARKTFGRLPKLPILPIITHQLWSSSAVNYKHLQGNCLYYYM